MPNHTATQRLRKSTRIGLYAMLVGGIIGLLASFVLSVEALELAKNPDVILSCSVSGSLNCATVAKHPSATLLGFPNSFIGMIALPVVITIAVVLLAGVRLPRWFVRATSIGALAGFVFAGWMLYQSFFVIQVFCPWCLLTDVAMLLIAFGVVRYAALHKAITLSDDRLEKFVVRDYDIAVLIGLIVLIAAAIIAKYGNLLL